VVPMIEFLEGGGDGGTKGLVLLKTGKNGKGTRKEKRGGKKKRESPTGKNVFFGRGRAEESGEKGENHEGGPELAKKNPSENKKKRV